MRTLCDTCGGDLEFSDAHVVKRQGKKPSVSVRLRCANCGKHALENVPVTIVREAMKSLAEFEAVFGAAE